MRAFFFLACSVIVVLSLLPVLLTACGPTQGALIARGGDQFYLVGIENPYYEIKWADGSVDFYSAERYECRYYTSNKTLPLVGCWLRATPTDVVWGASYYVKVRSGPE